MALITYADKSSVYQNSDVPATNKCQAVDMNEIKTVVNTNYNEQIKKDIISLKLDSNFTIPTSNTQTQITGFSIAKQVGTGLSLSSNKVVIGAGIKTVLVSYNAKHISSNNTTRSFSYLKHNTDNLSQEGAFFSATNQQITVCLAPQLVSVSQGDTFEIDVYGQQNNQIGGSADWRTTSLYVEVVEYS